MPHSAQRVHEALGGTGTFLPQPEIREVDDLDGGTAYPIITGDYSAQPRWAPEPVVPGTPVRPPTPVFRKLAPEVVEEELARLA
jgi:methionyl-tRNA synthetase